MNTINTIRHNMTIRNSSQTPINQQAQTQIPAFRGALGDKVVKEIANKKALTTTGIVAMAAGLIGLSKDKVNDIVDSLVDRIYGLQNKNDALVKELQETRVDANQKETKMRAEFNDNERRLRDSFSATLQQKNAEITEKDAKIAELQKYEGMAKVKSVDELDIISPEQFLELLQEAKDSQLKAEESLLNYLFNGNGQEEFIAQIERSNKILKAREARITDIPEMRDAFNNITVRNMGYNSVYFAQNMMKKVLQNSEKGVQINYPPIRKQVQENADAIINPMKNKFYTYSTNEKILNEVTDFYKNLDSNKERLKNEGWIFEQRSVNSENKAYYTYVNDKNEKYDIYVEDLAYGSFGYGRKTLADGRVYSYHTDGYWN